MNKYTQTGFSPCRSYHRGSVPKYVVCLATTFSSKILCSATFSDSSLCVLAALLSLIYICLLINGVEVIVLLDTNVSMCIKNLSMFYV